MKFKNIVYATLVIAGVTTVIACKKPKSAVQEACEAKNSFEIVEDGVKYLVSYEYNAKTDVCDENRKDLGSVVIEKDTTVTFYVPNSIGAKENGKTILTRDQLSKMKETYKKGIDVEIDVDLREAGFGDLGVFADTLIAYKEDKVIRNIKTKIVWVGPSVITNQILVDLFAKIGIEFSLTDPRLKSKTELKTKNALTKLGAFDKAKTVRTNRFAKNGKADFRSHSTASLATA